jgi:hypothetical protein
MYDNRLFITASFAAILSAAAVAAPLTWEQLVESVDKDPVYQTSEKRSQAASQDVGTKLWDNLEFRYQLDGFSFAKHDFELRLKPKSFGIGSADKRQYETLRDYQKARLAVDRSYLLYDRYERALRYVIRRKIAEIDKQLYQVNLDRIEVLHLKAGSETFNSQDLIVALEQESARRAELLGDSTALKDAELKLRSWVPDFDSVGLDTSWLPTMDELAKGLQDGIAVNDQFPEVMKAKSKMEYEQAKSKRDLAKGNDFISHIGVGYSLKIESLMKKYKELDKDDVAESAEYYDYQDEWLDKFGCSKWSICKGGTAEFLVPDKDDRQLKDKFFVNLAIRLPFFDDNNGNALRNQVDELDAESDYLDAVRTLTQKVSRLSEEIVALVAQWKVQKDFVEKVNAGNLFEDFAQSAGADPLLLLRARESALESDLKALKLEYDIFDRYLILLTYTGIFANPNVKNHLREGLK